MVLSWFLCWSLWSWWVLVGHGWSCLVLVVLVAPGGSWWVLAPTRMFKLMIKIIGTFVFLLSDWWGFVFGRRDDG